MTDDADFSDDELLRYSRQILLPGFDVDGQQKLRASRVLVVGAGGLGCPAALYLAAAGIGRLTLVDPDHIDLSNLQRQIAHRTRDIGRNKAERMAEACADLNSLVLVDGVVARVEEPWLREKLGSATAPAFDCVLDCSDNFATRAAVNRACRRARVPLVSGAAIRMEGQLAVFDFRRHATPCYACLYGEDGGEDAACVRNGVMSPVVGVVGAMQALAAIRVLAGYGETTHGMLSVFDGLRGEWRNLRIAADPACPVCAG